MVFSLLYTLLSSPTQSSNRTTASLTTRRRRSDSSTTTATTGLSRRLLVSAKSSSGRALICSVFSVQESLPCRRFRRSSRVFALFPHVRSDPHYKLLALRSHSTSAQVHTRVIDVHRSLSSFANLGPKRTRFLVSLLNALLGVLGLGVLVCHLHATSVALRSSDRGCLLELRPWGKFAYTCVTLEVSCSQKKIQGEQDKINQLLEGMDALGVQSLVISHCSRLEMPSRLLSLTNLKRIKIFNSSVTAWDASAAISGSTNPLLGIVSLIETNLSTIPEGTNLTKAPDDMHKSWTRIKFFSLEASPMVTAIPPSVGLIKTLLGANMNLLGAQVIPDQLFANNSMRQIILDGNPLVSQPTSVGSPLLLDAVSFQHTNVARIPVEWFPLYTKPNIFGNRLALAAGHTPLCLALQRGDYESIVTKSGSAAVTRVSDVAFRVGIFRVDCTSSPLHRQYPQHAETKWREKNRH